MAGQEQGHEHGECDVARRVCEYDLDAVLVGAECSPRAGAGAGRGVHEDPMFVGAKVK